MAKQDTKEFIELCKFEGWEVDKGQDGSPCILAEGRQFPIAHPFAIHSKIYRTDTNPDTKYMHLKRMHDILWPKYIDTWNYWDERRFREHCKPWKYVSYAGGASCGKSHLAARLALLYWLAAPAKRTVLVASTSLESLNSRIFGYVVRFLYEIELNLPFEYRRGNPPKILFNSNDKVHGIYAVAAKQGDDDRAIRDIIGRHPDEGLMVILDESTDMPDSLLSALPNLQAGDIHFQLTAIGNSKSKNDLHGALSTPKDGWKSVDPMKDIQWETTQKDGTCLFFSCYESPAIHEPDPVKRRLLSKFLVTREQINSKEKLYGSDSEAFMRFVLGYWRIGSDDDTVISPLFLKEFGVRKTAEWGGYDDLVLVAGLDVAYSTGGDDCLLRLAVLGQDVQGRVLLDFRKEELIYKIDISAMAGVASEIQIAEQVIAILNKYNVTLDRLAVDATGQGRAISSVIQLKAQSTYTPIKIYSVKHGKAKETPFDIVVKSTLDLWTDIRDFIQTDQLRGIDEETLLQLTSRLIVPVGTTGRYTLENKPTYKARMNNINSTLAHSPDRADALSLCLQAAKIRMGFVPGQKREVTRDSSHILDKLYALQDEVRGEAIMNGGAEVIPVASFSGDMVGGSSLGLVESVLEGYNSGL